MSLLGAKAQPKNCFQKPTARQQDHSLSDAGSIAEIGPNLNQIRPQVQTILMAVRNGIGVMPAMEGILTDDEIEAVAHYTSIAAEQ